MRATDSPLQIDNLADRPELLPELSRLQHAEWGRFNSGRTLDERIANLQRCSLGRTVPTTVIATQDGILLGSAMLVDHDMSTRPDISPWLAGVLVKPEFRRRGIATRLIERIEQEATSFGIPTLHLYTDTASRFYAKRGWSWVEDCAYRNVRVTIMRRTLAG